MKMWKSSWVPWAEVRPVQRLWLAMALLLAAALMGFYVYLLQGHVMHAEVKRQARAVLAQPASKTLQRPTAGLTRTSLTSPAADTLQAETGLLRAAAR